MSQKEALRPEVIRQVLESAQAQVQVQAALLLGLSVRQVKRLCRRMHQHGAKGRVSQRRGRPSIRRVATPQCEHCLNLVREQQASGHCTRASAHHHTGRSTNQRRLRSSASRSGRVQHCLGDGLSAERQPSTALPADPCPAA